MLTASWAVTLFAQLPEQEIRRRLDYIYSGQTDRVRDELPSLEKKYPEDAGVRYLDAILTTDAVQAVKKFQTIVDHFPQSDWADDALHKVYQYYYSIGLYKTADQKLAQLKTQYPHSIYVIQADSGLATNGQEHTPRPDSIAEVREGKDTGRVNVAETNRYSVIKETEEKYAVQTGAFSAMDHAQKQVTFLSTIGKNATVSSKQIGDKKLYVVSLEGFSNEIEARNCIAELKSKYSIDAIIIVRKE